MSRAFEFDDGLTARWKHAVEAHRIHAQEMWPEEAGGLILEDGSYAALPNVSPEPLVAFEFSPQDVMLASESRYVAVLHSHTSVEDEETGRVEPPQDCPSGADMECQIDTGVPWGITMALSTGTSAPFWFGDQVPRPPLIERPFRHGVNDCYSLVRDWHRETLGIQLLEFVRDPDWWLREDADRLDLYAQGFEGAGFRRVSREAGPLPGDCFICRVRSPVLNHAGVYIGNGLILHHLAHQLSGRDPANVWRTKLALLVRHRDLPDDWRPDDAPNG